MDNKVFTAVNKLMKINRAHKHLIDSQVAKIGIHRTQHRILMHLAKTGHLPSQKHLAEVFEISPAAITGALQKLEGDGYIERKVGTDNRFNEVIITEKGKEVIERTRALFTEVDDSLFEGFSDTDLADFSAYLDKIIVNLKGKEENETMV